VLLTIRGRTEGQETTQSLVPGEGIPSQHVRSSVRHCRCGDKRCRWNQGITLRVGQGPTLRGFGARPHSASREGRTVCGTHPTISPTQMWSVDSEGVLSSVVRPRTTLFRRAGTLALRGGRAHYPGRSQVSDVHRTSRAAVVRTPGVVPPCHWPKASNARGLGAEHPKDAGRECAGAGWIGFRIRGQRVGALACSL
jgi:hypothetical protein